MLNEFPIYEVKTNEVVTSYTLYNGEIITIGIFKNNPIVYDRELESVYEVIKNFMEPDSKLQEMIIEALEFTKIKKRPPKSVDNI